MYEILQSTTSKYIVYGVQSLEIQVLIVVFLSHVYIKRKANKFYFN